MSEQSPNNQFNEADSKADAVAAVALILIAVATLVHFVTG